MNSRPRRVESRTTLNMVEVEVEHPFSDNYHQIKHNKRTTGNSTSE